VASGDSFSEEGRARVRRQMDLAKERRYTELLSSFGSTFRRPWYNWLLRARLRLRRAKYLRDMNSPDEILFYLDAGYRANEPDVYRSLSQITARTLVIGGEQDQFFGQRLSDTANAIRFARLHLLPNETHMAPIECSKDFRYEIAAFLAESEQ
jgi:pimeloyl-ACP methyl ester carboxylesterase